MTTASRFFTKDDPKTSNFVYTLPEAWWSRPYEYEWTKNFCSPGDVVLDAASGVIHPLRFWLSEHCKEVYSCDLDKNIELPLESFIADDSLHNGFDQEMCKKLLPQPKNLYSACASITNLPYQANFFDKIFCISVLEHLRDFFNSKPNLLLPLFPLMHTCLPTTIFDTIREFKRVLKDDGQIILTFDHPDISIKYLAFVVENLGLRFVGSFTQEMPDNALSIAHRGRQYQLYRAVLEKKQ